jgi:hypothetical protein
LAQFRRRDGTPFQGEEVIEASGERPLANWQDGYQSEKQQQPERPQTYIRAVPKPTEEGLFPAGRMAKGELYRGS